MHCLFAVLSCSHTTTRSVTTRPSFFVHRSQDPLVSTVGRSSAGAYRSRAYGGRDSPSCEEAAHTLHSCWAHGVGGAGGARGLADVPPATLWDQSPCTFPSQRERWRTALREPLRVACTKFPNEITIGFSFFALLAWWGKLK